MPKGTVGQLTVGEQVPDLELLKRASNRRRTSLTNRTGAPEKDGEPSSTSTFVSSVVSSPPYDRVVERRRAVALARHLRESEGLSIAQIAARLGRSPATVKAYFYDPTNANKGLSRERVATAGGREVWSHLPAAAARREIQPRRTLLCARLGCPARPVGLGF